MSITDQLRKLAELHSAGSLTDEEFAAAKSQLLGAASDSSSAPTAAHDVRGDGGAPTRSPDSPHAFPWRSTRARVLVLAAVVMLVGVAASATAVLTSGPGSTGSQAKPAPTDAPSATTTSEAVISPPPEAPSPGSPSPEVPEPQDSDFRAVAIYTIQTETRSYANASDGVVKDLLELTCFGLLITDGRNVDDQGIEMAEAGLDAAGVRKTEYPLVMRAATAFCPKAFDEIAARYGA